jgi:hypothetical protein
MLDASRDVPSGIVNLLNLTGLSFNANGTLPFANVSVPVNNKTSANVQYKLNLMQWVQRINQTYYHYKGSLTTQPCTDNVNYIVFNEVQYIQFAAKSNFQRFWSGNRNFTKNGRGNNRNIQPLNGRTVFQKTTTYEQWFATLTNHYMLPADSAMSIQGLSMLLLASAASLLF